MHLTNKSASITGRSGRRKKKEGIKKKYKRRNERVHLDLCGTRLFVSAQSIKENRHNRAENPRSQIHCAVRV
jgi:hypothetical protein